MEIEANLITYDGGELDTAYNIVVDKTLRFDSLIDLYEALTPHAKALYLMIEGELSARARRDWQLELANRADHKRYDARR